MLRHSQTISVWLIGLFALAACSNVGAVDNDAPVGQTNDVETSSPKKRVPKKRAPRRAPAKVNQSEETPAPLPVISITVPPAPLETVIQSPSLPLPLPPSPASSRSDLPNPPKKFHGVVKRLCHPLKGKYFFLNARWKKGVSPSIVAYRIYVNGICEKSIQATRKPCLQVLRHTRHLRKIYEISAVDKEGNESVRTPLVVRYRKPNEPHCICRVARFTPDFLQLTPEYLGKLSKESIIDVIQQLRKELIEVQDLPDVFKSRGGKSAEKD